VCFMIRVPFTACVWRGERSCLLLETWLWLSFYFFPLAACFMGLGEVTSPWLPSFSVSRATARRPRAAWVRESTRGSWQSAGERPSLPDGPKRSRPCTPYRRDFRRKCRIARVCRPEPSPAPNIRFILGPPYRSSPGQAGPRRQVGNPSCNDGTKRRCSALTDVPRPS